MRRAEEGETSTWADLFDAEAGIHEDDALARVACERNFAGDDGSACLLRQEEGASEFPPIVKLVDECNATCILLWL